MKKLMLGTAVAVLASSVATAQDYQFEVGAGYVDGDMAGVDYDGFGLNARAHLDRVDTTKGPLNEAAFLDKSSFVDLTWATFEYDVPGSFSVDTIGLSGRFVTKGNVIVEASYSDIDSDVTGDETVISLGVGTYINENTDVVVSYEDYDEADRSSLSVDAHGVNKLEGETSLAFDLGLAYLDISDESGYGISAGADYYVDKALSFGAGASLMSVDNYDESSIDVRANYFVTPVVRLGLSYMTLGQDADGDAIELNASMRF